MGETKTRKKKNCELYLRVRFYCYHRRWATDFGFPLFDAEGIGEGDVEVSDFGLCEGV